MWLRFYPALRRGRRRGANTGKKLPLETGGPTNRGPGQTGGRAFMASVLSGDAFVEVSHVMPQERTTPKLSEALTQRSRSLEFRCRPE